MSLSTLFQRTQKIHHPYPLRKRVRNKIHMNFLNFLLHSEVSNVNFQKMTTFQAIIYGIIHGFTEFLPVSANAHRLLLPYFLGWPEPSGPIAGALALGTLMSVLIFFRHDWLSMLSCFLQVLIYRKKPMTLDERLPIFLVLTTIPTAFLWHSAQSSLFLNEWTNPIWILSGLIFFSIPLWLLESFNKRNKSMFNWNWLDCLIVGITQATQFFPGSGSVDGGLIGAFFRNYNREAAVKYVFLSTAPFLATKAIIELRQINFHASSPTYDVSWLSFSAALLMATLTGLLTIGGFTKQLQRKGVGQYIAYRLLLAIAVGATYWFRQKS